MNTEQGGRKSCLRIPVLLVVCAVSLGSRGNRSQSDSYNAPYNPGCVVWPQFNLDKLTKMIIELESCLVCNSHL